VKRREILPVCKLDSSIVIIGYYAQRHFFSRRVTELCHVKHLQWQLSRSWHACRIWTTFVCPVSTIQYLQVTVSYRVSSGWPAAYGVMDGHHSDDGFWVEGCSTKRSSPFGFDSGWKWADRGVELPSSQNSTSPSALSEPLLTRSPFSRRRSSIVTDLSEKIC
jgi:hypothetical protein